MHVCASACTCVCACVWVLCIHVRTCVRASVCACVCLCVYTGAHVRRWKPEVDAEHCFQSVFHLRDRVSP